METNDVAAHVTHLAPSHCVRRFFEAINSRNLSDIPACYSPTYQSVQPCRPSRNFTGGIRVQQNYEMLVGKYSNFQMLVFRVCDAGDTVWAEAQFDGLSEADGSVCKMPGVFIFGVDKEYNVITWGKLYFHPVDETPQSIQEFVAHMTKH